MSKASVQAVAAGERTDAVSVRAKSVELDRVSIHFGEGPHAVQALDEIALKIPAGQFVSILGPSGCGKSTILNAIGGFGSLTAGAVYVGDERVKGAGADRGIVFQQHTLLPW
jgi:NitT/TauT family transport system ATP-binding protein